ncbi:MAG: ribosomal L7Ae/L30e/S12e/Gadd45 family protein [Lactobacillus sp.]|nr:ribosomal L7Ae/L30e/S12e/Gadd45 family protein [Lactobacillus sp.]
MNQRQKVLNFLGLAQKAGKLVTGTDAVILGLKAKKVYFVLVGSDLTQNSLEKITQVSSKVNVIVNQDFTSDEISQAIGQERKVIGLIDQKFSKALKQKIKEGV